MIEVEKYFFPHLRWLFIHLKIVCKSSLRPQRDLACLILICRDAEMFIFSELFLRPLSKFRIPSGTENFY